MTILDTATDLTSHHIEGITREGNVPFNVPLITHVIGNLWQGGCIHVLKLPDDFDFQVSLYPQEQYQLGPKTARITIDMRDSQEIPNLRLLHDVANIVNAFRARGKTLLNCQAGLNRSSLVAGLALILEGKPPDEAIALLRKRRSPAVLCNKAFERWLLDYPSSHSAITR